MRTGEQLGLGAMRKELVRLSRAAERAKKEADECMAIGDELIAIHKEFVEIVNSKDTGAETVARLGRLKERRDRAEKIMKKDLVKLLDKSHEAEFAKMDLAKEIQMVEFRHSLRRAS